MKSYTFNNGTYTHTIDAENTSQAWIGLADKVDCTSDYSLTDISASCEKKEHHNLKGEDFSKLSLLSMVGDDEPAVFNHIEGLPKPKETSRPQRSLGTLIAIASGGSFYYP